VPQDPASGRCCYSGLFGAGTVPRRRCCRGCGAVARGCEVSMAVWGVGTLIEIRFPQCQKGRVLGCCPIFFCYLGSMLAYVFAHVGFYFSIFLGVTATLTFKKYVYTLPITCSHLLGMILSYMEMSGNFPTACIKPEKIIQRKLAG
jgi:hypothetical protein